MSDINAENKYWGKALCYILRHRVNYDPMPKATLIHMVRSSHRYGAFTEEKFERIFAQDQLAGNASRYVKSWMRDPGSGWWTELINARDFRTGDR